MKYIISSILLLLFTGCTQENTSNVTEEVKQVSSAELTNTKENNETNHTSIVKPAVPIVTQKIQTIISSEAPIKEASAPEPKDGPKEESPEENILEEEEENDSTPPPPKSQEELDDEAEAERTEVPIPEEDSDEIEMEKSANELEDEAANIVGNEEAIPEEEIEVPTKFTEEIHDEQVL